MNGGPGLSIAAGPKMWNSRFRECRRDSPRKDWRFDGFQILLTWVLADKHYWTQPPAPIRKGARFRNRPLRGPKEPRDVPHYPSRRGSHEASADCSPTRRTAPAPLRWQRDGERRTPKLTCQAHRCRRKSQRYSEEQTAAATWVRNAGALPLQCGRYKAQLNPRRHCGATQDAEG